MSGLTEKYCEKSMSTNKAERETNWEILRVSVSFSEIKNTDGCAEGTLKAEWEQTLFLATKKTKSLAY